MSILRCSTAVPVAAAPDGVQRLAIAVQQRRAAQRRADVRAGDGAGAGYRRDRDAGVAEIQRRGRASAGRSPPASVTAAPGGSSALFAATGAPSPRRRPFAADSRLVLSVARFAAAARGAAAVRDPCFGAAALSRVTARLAAAAGAGRRRSLRLRRCLAPRFRVAPPRSRSPPLARGLNAGAGDRRRRRIRFGRTRGDHRRALRLHPQAARAQRRREQRRQRQADHQRGVPAPARVRERARDRARSASRPLITDCGADARPAPG